MINNAYKCLENRLLGVFCAKPDIQCRDGVVLSTTVSASAPPGASGRWDCGTHWPRRHRRCSGRRGARGRAAPEAGICAQGHSARLPGIPVVPAAWDGSNNSTGPCGTNQGFPRRNRGRQEGLLECRNRPRIFRSPRRHQKVTVPAYGRVACSRDRARPHGLVTAPPPRRLPPDRRRHGLAGLPRHAGPQPHRPRQLARRLWATALPRPACPPLDPVGRQPCRGHAPPRHAMGRDPASGPPRGFGQSQGRPRPWPRRCPGRGPFLLLGVARPSARGVSRHSVSYALPAPPERKTRRPGPRVARQPRRRPDQPARGVGRLLPPPSPGRCRRGIHRPARRGRRVLDPALWQTRLHDASPGPSGPPHRRRHRSRRHPDHARPHLGGHLRIRP